MVTTFLLPNGTIMVNILLTYQLAVGKQLVWGTFHLWFAEQKNNNQPSWSICYQLHVNCICEKTSTPKLTMSSKGNTLVDIKQWTYSLIGGLGNSSTNLLRFIIWLNVICTSLPKTQFMSNDSNPTCPGPTWATHITECNHTSKISNSYTSYM